MWIFTETWKKHLKSIQPLLNRLQAAKLTAKVSKCKIGYSKIECCGHNIQDQTLRPKDDKIQAIKEAQGAFLRIKSKVFCVWRVLPFKEHILSEIHPKFL